MSCNKEERRGKGLATTLFPQTGSVSRLTATLFHLLITVFAPVAPAVGEMRVPAADDLVVAVPQNAESADEKGRTAVRAAAVAWAPAKSDGGLNAFGSDPGGEAKNRVCNQKRGVYHDVWWRNEGARQSATSEKMVKTEGQDSLAFEEGLARKRVFDVRCSDLAHEQM